MWFTLQFANNLDVTEKKDKYFFFKYLIIYIVLCTKPVWWMKVERIWVWAWLMIVIIVCFHGFERF